MEKAIRIVGYAPSRTNDVIDQIIEIELSYRKDGTVGKGFDKIIGEFIEEMENGGLAKIELHLVPHK